jgi:hypothetical protein
VRGGLLAGQDVAVGVAAQHADVGQSLQKFQHLGRTRAEQDKVAQCPPSVDAQTLGVFQYRA